MTTAGNEARKTELQRFVDKLRVPGAILRSAFGRMMSDDGWALASHLALTIILAIFPFLIFVTALAGLLGIDVTAHDVQQVVFEGWPETVSGPIAKEVETVLTVGRRDLLTFGGLLTIWFASNGVEALRVALERAYGVQGKRAWWKARLISIGFALIGAVGLLVLTALIVLGPIIWEVATREIPGLIPYTRISRLVRYGSASLALGIGLVAAHLWLPVGRRRLRDVMPGVLVTLVLWLGSAGLFGYYLSNFSTYTATYAGLGGIMAALVFLNLNALCFIFGAEINAAIFARRLRKAAERHEDERRMAEAAAALEAGQAGRETMTA
jgi:membrane protein